MKKSNKLYLQEDTQHLIHIILEIWIVLKVGAIVLQRLLYPIIAAQMVLIQIVGVEKKPKPF